MDPWISDYPVGWQMNRFNLHSQPPTQVEFYPRQQEGRVVLRRARWRFPVQEIPVRQQGETDFDLFARVQRWRQEHGLPEEVYASPEREKLSLEAKARKPIWLHLSSPHTLELLRQLLDKDVTAICLTEALPARHQHWFPAGDASDGRKVSEFMALACWPMPRPEQKQRNDVSSVLSALPGLAGKSRGDAWLYFKIYPAYSDQMDDVIRRIVSPAIELARSQDRLKRWFFIRYIDQRGWHIRLRLLGAEQQRAEMQQAIGQLIEQALPLLAHEKPRYLLPVRYTPGMQEGQSGYTLARYEPECEKYGGQVGVRLAERFFEASSELVLQVLQGKEPGEGYRRLLSLRFMELMVEAICSTPQMFQMFWKRYLWYWSGQDRPGAAEIRANFTHAAQVRRTLLRRQFAEFPELPRTRLLLNHYQVAVLSLVEQLTRAGSLIATPASSLCFDYVHMTNNRLGIAPLEEGYLAALLLEMHDHRGLDRQEVI
jgi:thiopeptide-type bacteriocin biosynthesis protein